MSLGNKFQTIGPAAEKANAVRAKPVVWDGDLMTAGQTCINNLCKFHINHLIC